MSERTDEQRKSFEIRWPHSDEAVQRGKTMTDDEADTRGPAIVVHGSVLGGFKFVGPFDTISAALEWWKTTLYGAIQAPVTIVLLEKPFGPLEPPPREPSN